MERVHRRRLLNEVFEDIRATRSGFSASDNMSREALHDRDAMDSSAEQDYDGTRVINPFS